jgi:hypothetical protein
MCGFIGRNPANLATVTFDEILGGLAKPANWYHFPLNSVLIEKYLYFNLEHDLNYSSCS